MAGARDEVDKPSGLADKANIPTDLLRTFVAICELGSFTKAAHLFGLTQPAVSAHMRRLETIIGSDLIEKNMSGVKLTVCGGEVLRQARRILAIEPPFVGYHLIDFDPSKAAAMKKACELRPQAISYCEDANLLLPSIFSTIRYKEFKRDLHEAAFELIEIPHVRQSGKNSADISVSGRRVLPAGEIEGGPPAHDRRHR